MRIYSSAVEMLDETVRDIWTRGEKSFDPTVQGKKVDPVEFEMLELVPYDYKLMPVGRQDMEAMVARAGKHFPGYNATPEYLDAYFKDRISGYSNPEPTLRRRKLWKELVEPNGKFSYSYAERMALLPHYIDALKRNPNMRGCYLGIWDTSKDYTNVGSGRRVPCSLGYHFVIRNGALTLIYMMRSCDLATHFASDVYLALKLQEHVASAVGFAVGPLVHFISSLHVYKKDVPADRKW